MGEVTTLREAVTELVRDGDSIALEGFTHLIPHAAAHEIIRQQRRRLTIIRMTPDPVCDQRIGMGCAYDLPHAEMHTVVLPHAVAFNGEAIPEVMERIADALGAEGAATGLYELAARIGAPTALKDIGMKEEDIHEAVGLILDAAPESNPRPVDEAGIRSILEDAYACRRPEPVAERSV